MSPKPRSASAAARRVLLASPHGFCAGVDRAVGIAEALLREAAGPVYCLNQVVHNAQVIGALAARGMIFVTSLAAVPRGATLLLSAHGVSPEVRLVARRRRLKVVDATCPFVARLHTAVRRHVAADHAVLLIGHRHHEEVVGVAGEAPDRVQIVESEEDARRVQPADPERLALVTQTTLSSDVAARLAAILRSRFPTLREPRDADICYATRNRQEAVRLVAARSAFVVVLGSPNSSNSNRLVEVARAAGTPAALADTLAALAALPLDAVDCLGLTAGASTPESFVRAALRHLRAVGFTRVQSCVAVREHVRFPLPGNRGQPLPS